MYPFSKTFPQQMDDKFKLISTAIITVSCNMIHATNIHRCTCKHKNASVMCVQTINNHCLVASRQSKSNITL